MTPDIISSKLQKMPSWANVPKDESVEADGIMKTLIEIDQYPTDIIRKGITLFYHPDASVEDMGRLLILNKFLFKLPEWLPEHSCPRFGGWLNIPERDGQINILWPFSRDKNGNMMLTHRFSGYLGEAYMALEAFDYYLNKYGRRN